jgi:hypothetical protein
MQLSLVVGILVAYLLAIPYEHDIQYISIGGWDVAWWRFVFSVGAFGSAIQVGSFPLAWHAPYFAQSHPCLPSMLCSNQRYLCAPGFSSSRHLRKLQLPKFVQVLLLLWSVESPEWLTSKQLDTDANFATARLGLTPVTNSAVEEPLLQELQV